MSAAAKRACFEVSWEIANAVGGIHTVIASKAKRMLDLYGDRYFVIGPWLRGSPHQDRVWEDHSLEPLAMRALAPLPSQGIRFRPGRWKVPGRPHGLLVDFESLWEGKDRLLAEYWERFGLDSLGGGHDYEEPLLFGVAAGRAAEKLCEWLLPGGYGVVLQAHEWLAGGALLRLAHSRPEVARVFTTHATVLGRSLAQRSHLPAAPLAAAEARRLAQECGVRPKHSMEAVCARLADVFTTVSETTAQECGHVLGLRPALVTPNALAEDYPPARLRRPEARERSRARLLELASRTTGCSYLAPIGAEGPLILLTSGRYEFRNKGLDVFTEALGLVRAELGLTCAPQVIAFYLVPAGSEADPPTSEREARRVSHRLSQPAGDPLLEAFDRAELANEPHSAVHVVFVPKYLDGTDARVPGEYFEWLAGADLTFFPSWYEPWGYTPMESVALGIPTVTSDLTGFSDWAALQGPEESTGVLRVRRRQRTHGETVRELAELITGSLRGGRAGLARYAKPALELSRRGTWATAVGAYAAAHALALDGAAERLGRDARATRVDSAYFSMEFAVEPDLHIYSGGLGVLAGDFLKAARDLGRRVCGLGIAYREGYFKQRISAGLRQETLPDEHASFERNGFAHVVDERGLPLVFEVPLPGGRSVHSSAWRLRLGSSQLLLLDTDLESNPPALRALGSRLYTPDRRERWLQEYLLGTGGVRLLRILGIRPDWLHMNEGHTALLAFEEIAGLVADRHLCFDEALAEVRQKTLFTTHTPVPAGHEEFERAVAGPELEMIAGQLRVEPERLYRLGRSAQGSGRFSMTALALASCSRVNAVSRRHRVAAERSFDRLMLEHKHLFSVTNGVHPQTWIGPEWQELYLRTLGSGWSLQSAEPDAVAEAWRRIRDLPDREVWGCHLRAKDRLLRSLVERLGSSGRVPVQPSRRAAIDEVLGRLSAGALIATFARRFTGYKRPELILTDLERLRRLLDDHPRTVLVFAGKAHPADVAGQELIHRVLLAERSDELRGHVLYLEDYGMTEGQLLVAGSDVWINLPQQPLEASGTSGMKAAMNGVLNLSVSDGWVPEAEHGEVPWKIGVATETLTRAEMDWVHAQELYASLELEVLPTFERGGEDGGASPEWVALMKRAIAAAVPYFSAQRMVREYAQRLGWAGG